MSAFPSRCRSQRTNLLRFRRRQALLFRPYRLPSHRLRRKMRALRSRHFRQSQTSSTTRPRIWTSIRSSGERWNPTIPNRHSPRKFPGTVTLLAMVDEYGKVTETAVVDAAPEGLFDESAQRALSRAAFSPAQRDGRNVRSRILVRVNYDPDKHLTVLERNRRGAEAQRIRRGRQRGRVAAERDERYLILADQRHLPIFPRNFFSAFLCASAPLRFRVPLR